MNNFLKNYHIINNLPEGAFDHRNQNAKQLKAFREWFFENKEQRLNELQNVFHAFSGKYLDFTPESLKGLGEFFLHAIDKEKKSPEEYTSQRAQFPADIPIPEYRMTIRSLSLTVDAGIYWGEVMIINHKNMRWEQNTTNNKRIFDRGYMVITLNHHGLKSAVNPIHINCIAGEGIADKTYSPDRMYELYKIYCEEVDPEFMPDI